MSTITGPDEPLTLAADFPAAPHEEWRALVEKTLRGRPFDKVMNTKTPDGFDIQALSVAGKDISARPDIQNAPWDILVPHWDPDAGKCNEALLEDLLRGATGIALAFAAGNQPGLNYNDFNQLLGGVYLNMLRIDLLPGEEYRQVSEAFRAYVSSTGTDLKEIRGTLGIDPLGTLARTGRLIEPVEEALAYGASTAKQLQSAGSDLKAFTVDTSAYHQAGATNSQELGLMLSTGIAYLRAMESVGLDLDFAASQIQFSIAVDSEVFVSMAKFRAARLLWAAVLKQCGINSAGMAFTAVNSLRMVSRNDPWVNILRSTAACFGAGTGGADSICLLPHDALLGMPSASARRISRNIQIILQEESGLARVADPAAGSFSIEEITSNISYKAWNYLNKIEKNNGIYASLADSALQVDLANSWLERSKAIAIRREPLTGVSEFPDVHEEKITGLAVPAVFIETTKEAAVTVEPLAMHRSAEGYETLRDKSDRIKDQSGTRPCIYLANLGSVADFTARATFAKNFFEAGGIEALNSEGGADIDVITNNFKDSGAFLAVICSSDNQYTMNGEALTKSLKKAGAVAVYLAGKPENAEALSSAGVDDFVKLGSNVLEVLSNCYAVMGEN